MNVVAGLLISLTLQVAPLDAGVLSLTKVTVNGASGDAFDPHVDGDVAAYTASNGVTQEIHYFNFGTSADAVISSALPGGGNASDMLSDVQGGRVVFTRLIPGDRSAVMIVDTTAAVPAPVELNPLAGSNRMGVSVGSRTVAWADFGFVPGAGEIVAWDLSTGTAARLTNDLINDQNPAVSPDGRAIVWEHCAGSIFACDIHQAVQTGTGWVVSSTVTALTGAQDPDVSNTLVAYSADRLTGTLTDIVLQPLAGGAAMALELPGDQVHPSLAGNLVAFESRLPGASASDIFLYDQASNRLFQITNTPLLNETLNDVTVLGTGQVRVVWDVNDKPNGIDRSVYGATFALPPVAPTAPVCANRATTLTASVLQHPRRWVDGQVTFAAPFRFAVPATLPITAGQPGTGVAKLSLTAHGVTTECTYVSARGHQESEGEDEGEEDGDAGEHLAGHGPRAAPAPVYTFRACSGAGSMLKAGSIAAVDALTLHVVAGARRGTTTVQLQLTEDCGSAAATFKLDQGGVGLPEATAVGCSSTAAAPSSFALAGVLVLAAWALRRRASQMAVPVRQGTRRLRG